MLEAARAVSPIEAPTIPVRTRFFDQRITQASQVVLLAAGMDARAFRLAWPPETRLFEIDHPEVLALKQERLGDARPACLRTTVPIDLAEDWPTALVARGFRPEIRTVWLAEGLLPYLDGPFVGTLLERLDRLSAARSVLLADLIGRTLLESPQLQPMLDFVRGLGAPWRFGTDAPEELLAPLGWEVTAHDLGSLAAEVGRWPWPVLPLFIPGIPRSFLVEARKSERR